MTEQPNPNEESMMNELNNDLITDIFEVLTDNNVSCDENEESLDITSTAENGIFTFDVTADLDKQLASAEKKAAKLIVSLPAEVGDNLKTIKTPHGMPCKMLSTQRPLKSLEEEKIKPGETVSYFSLRIRGLLGDDSLLIEVGKERFLTN
ncbi:hypothetical protein RF11_01300 [Thelohanellus kitauei]|uniref:Uncharacterized protein n=1 Tax=Thelohanellus kitauei TaxID=669202 RepID=A0A0C2IY40_THEKT|nr:hypothetical protein RF11_01300 [Thelohanellus kitauei]